MMSKIKEYLNQIQENECQDGYKWCNIKQTCIPISNNMDVPDLCGPTFKWNPQLQRCVPMGDGENIDYLKDR